MIGNRRMSEREAPMGDREKRTGVQGWGAGEGERARWGQTCKKRSMQKKLRKTSVRLHGRFWSCRSTRALDLQWLPQLSKTWPRSWYVWIFFSFLNNSSARMCDLCEEIPRPNTGRGEFLVTTLEWRTLGIVCMSPIQTFSSICISWTVRALRCRMIWCHDVQSLSLLIYFLSHAYSNGTMCVELISEIENFAPTGCPLQPGPAQWQRGSRLQPTLYD